MKDKKITFYPMREDIIDAALPPVLSKKTAPSWFKSHPRHIEDTSMPLTRSGLKNLTIKACLPVMDKMNFGYSIVLSSDIQINDNTHNHRISWSTNLDPIVSDHSLDQIPEEVIPDGYEKHVYKWINFWTIGTPPGYSIMVTHPSYRNDLPFITMDAIVDSDKMDFPINFPFVLRKDFTGVIKRGTPIAQIFPFKRDSWSHEIDDIPYQKSSIKKFLGFAEGWYKENVWDRKYFK